MGADWRTAKEFRALSTGNFQRAAGGNRLFLPENAFEQVRIVNDERTARSFSSPKPLQIQEIEKNLAEKTGICYNQHRKILVKLAEGWYEGKTA